jgi:hypothetical protein
MLKFAKVAVIPGGDIMITIFCHFRQFSAIFANFMQKWPFHKPIL